MKIKRFENKKGMTIIELVVAMAIFIIVITLAVGAFISILRLQSQTQTMTDVQQNGRIISEQLTRQARQAENLSIEHLTPTGHTSADHAPGSNIFDQLKITIGPTTTCFKVDDTGHLKKFDSDCLSNGLTLSSDDVKVTNFYFDQTSGIPPTLGINVTIESVNPAVGTSTDSIQLNTSVFLTGLK